MSDITVYYLEMHSPTELRAKDSGHGLSVLECEVPQYELNRFMYKLVGQHWSWRDRLAWSDQQWREYAERTELRTWLSLSRGSPAGYYELEKQGGGEVEIKYFGLARPFIGKGYGGYLLTHALRSAWAWGDTSRVWVHTCTLDHHGALDNYKARGMKLYKAELESA